MLCKCCKIGLNKRYKYDLCLRCRFKEGSVK